MDNRKKRVDLPKARRIQENNKAQRIQRAAEMSRTLSASEIMSELDISKRTLKRYTKDPRWQEHGGRPLTFAERGRPVQETLSTAEKQTLTEAHALHNQGHKWVAVAERLEIPIGRLEYLRRKEKQQQSEVKVIL